MINIFRPLFCLAILCVQTDTAYAGDSIQSGWLDLIRADVAARTGENCDVHVEKVLHSVIGNNGRMSERWTVEACGRFLTYEVDYFPPSAFPDREEDKVAKHMAD